MQLELLARYLPDICQIFEVLEILLLKVCQCKAGVEVCGECIPVVLEHSSPMETMKEEEANCGNYFVFKDQ